MASKRHVDRLDEATVEINSARGRDEVLQIIPELLNTESISDKTGKVSDFICKESHVVIVAES